MTYEPIWGSIIAWYLFLAGLGAGAYITSAFLGWRHPDATSMRRTGHIDRQRALHRLRDPLVGHLEHLWAGRNTQPAANAVFIHPCFHSGFLLLDFARRAVLFPIMGRNAAVHSAKRAKNQTIRLIGLPAQNARIFSPTIDTRRRRVSSPRQPMWGVRTTFSSV